MPVLYLFVNGSTAEHFCHHFLTLFQTLARQCHYKGLSVTDEDFTIVCLCYHLTVVCCWLYWLTCLFECRSLTLPLPNAKNSFLLSSTSICKINRRCAPGSSSVWQLSTVWRVARSTSKPPLSGTLASTQTSILNMQRPSKAWLSICLSWIGYRIFARLLQLSTDAFPAVACGSTGG